MTCWVLYILTAVNFAAQFEESQAAEFEGSQAAEEFYEEEFFEDFVN